MTASMKYVDEFRDPALIVAVAQEIKRTVDRGRHYRIMEVCGGHTACGSTTSCRRTTAASRSGKQR